MFNWYLQILKHEIIRSETFITVISKKVRENKEV